LVLILFYIYELKQFILINYSMSNFGSATSLAWHDARAAVHQVAHKPATRCVGLSIASFRPGVISLSVARIHHSAETEKFQ
jgi:hypothetical protein